MRTVTVVTWDGEEVGEATGGEYHCQMSGCTGMRIGVRWQDGALTYPCTKGMDWDGFGWRIIGGSNAG